MEIKKEKKAKRPKLEFDDEYIVERIVDHCEISPNKYLFCIKWKGWAQHHNTWEPLENLNCDSKLEDYLQKQTKIKSDPKKTNEIKMSLVDLNDHHIDLLLQKYIKSTKIKLPEVQNSLLEAILQFLAPMDPAKWDTSLQAKLKDLLELEVLNDLRFTQLNSLKNWERKINEADLGKVPLKVENNVDLEGPPLNFTFVKEYMCGKGVTIPSDPIIGCNCGEKCRGFANKCCANSSNSIYAYRKGKLNIDRGVPIYECNKRCNCGPDCSNRIIQRGRSKRLSIFRTSNNCGWGLRAREPISKGSFVTQYVGEVITNEEAEKRGLEYDADGRTYLFDLDFNGEENPYTVDATSYGNESHFINHSCDPNTAIFAAFIDCLDPNLPLLAIFAIKDIKTGDEITFDYRSQRNLNNSVTEDNSEDDNLFKNYLCRCNSLNCRKYLFS